MLCSNNIQVHVAVYESDILFDGQNTLPVIPSRRGRGYFWESSVSSHRFTFPFTKRRGYLTLYIKKEKLITFR
jgi:hypothetical protein